MSDERIRVTCEACSKTILVAQKFLGRRVRCPNCTQTIHISNGDTSQRTDLNAKSQVISRQANEILGDRYTLERRLGEGGFGSVWLAKDEHIGRSVAIKLPKFDRRDGKRVARFIAEAHACAKLSHPNIVTLYDAGEFEGGPFLAIEYIEGLSLDSYVQQNPISIEQTLNFTEQLAEALQYAHEQGVVHRDIKPQNVVVTSQGIPKIVDFGLAKLLEQKQGLTVDGTLLGTPAYMAPEQARGAIDEIGPCSDQYSLGMLLYWMLAGEVPFTGPSIAVVFQVINDIPPSIQTSRPGVDSQLDAICQKAISKSIQDRYRSCADLLRDLRNYRSGNEIAARPLTKYQRVLRWTKRNPKDMALLLAGAFVILIGIVVSTRGFTDAWALSAQAEETRKAAEIELGKQRAVEADIDMQWTKAKSANERATAAEQLAAKRQAEIEATNVELNAVLAKISSLTGEITVTQETIRDSRDAQDGTKRDLAQLTERRDELSSIRDGSTIDKRYKKVGTLIANQDWQAAKIELLGLHELIDNPSWTLLDQVVRNQSTSLVLKGMEIDGELQRFDWNNSIAYDKNSVIDIDAWKVVFKYQNSPKPQPAPFYIPALKLVFDQNGDGFLPGKKSTRRSTENSQFSFIDFIWNPKRGTVYGIDHKTTGGSESTGVYEFADKQWRNRWSQEKSKAQNIQGQKLTRIVKLDDKSSFALIFSNDDAIVFGPKMILDGVQPLHKVLPNEYAQHDVARYSSVLTLQPEGMSWRERASDTLLKLTAADSRMSVLDGSTPRRWQTWVTPNKKLLVATDGWIGVADLDSSVASDQAEPAK